jgi:hypothetical protein
VRRAKVIVGETRKVFAEANEIIARSFPLVGRKGREFGSSLTEVDAYARTVVATLPTAA